MSIGEQIHDENGQDWGQTEPLIDDAALLCPVTEELCPVKVLLREDHQVGSDESPASREAAGIRLGVALSLHEEAFAQGLGNCQVGQACPAEYPAFELPGQTRTGEFAVQEW